MGGWVGATCCCIVVALVALHEPLLVIHIITDSSASSAYHVSSSLSTVGEGKQKLSVRDNNQNDLNEAKIILTPPNFHCR